MTTRLALVCHAATSATHRASFPADEPILAPPAPLPERVEVAVCGPARACRETAAALGLAAVVEPRLADCDYGRWAGLALESLPADEVGRWLADPSVAPHGGESIVDLITRVGGWLDSVVGSGSRILAVVSPGVVRASVVYGALGAPESFWRVDVSPLGRAEFAGNAGRWNLRELTR
jgi:broad specificity phosphatase PhoE